MTPAALLLALIGLLPLQEPDDNLTRALADQNPAARRGAAERLAGLGVDAEKWLLSEADKGDPRRRRALVLAAALMGTERSFHMLDKAASSNSRPVRTYALFLYAAHHPEAIERPERTLGRAKTDFERALLLAGLLTRARSLDIAVVRGEVGKRRHPAVRALLLQLEALGGGQLESKVPETVGDFAARLLGSVLPGSEPLPASWLQSNMVGELPGLWSVAALRTPPRTLAALREQPSGGEGAGLALVLYEVPPARRQESFDVLEDRLVGKDARAWLWGSAGDLGLSFPEPVLDKPLDDAQIAGILRLGLVDWERSRKEAVRRLPAARLRFHAGASVARDWPAAVVLALAGQEQDRETLRKRIEAADDREKARLLPIWQLSLGRISTEEARAGWLQRWSRSVHAGYQGYLDQEGPRWVARMLVGGTQAAVELDPLTGDYPGLDSPPEFSKDDTLYPDLAELLLSDLYRWDLP